MFDQLLERHPRLLERLEETITGEAFFQIFQQLSDNYSPSLTVSRVQGPLVAQLITQNYGTACNVVFERNARKSGCLTIQLGASKPALWMSAHADICSYLTKTWDGKSYPLIPFCEHRVSPGIRKAVALASPSGDGPLDRLVVGEMVTTPNQEVSFVCNRNDLPLHTRVTHHIPAAWDPTNGEITGFLDNQAGTAALILAGQVLSLYEANVLLLIADEEEGPVDKGNQGFSRASNRLLHRTPLSDLPDYFIVCDGHSEDVKLASGQPTAFGNGASYSGLASLARGAVTPPQLLAFTRELASWLDTKAIKLHENTSYVGRSDDISAMQFTPNISIIGYPGAYSHFEQKPIAQISDLINLTKSLVVVALIAQDDSWRIKHL